MPAYNKLVRIHCKAGSVSVRLFLKHEPNVKTLLLDKKMMVSPMQLTVPSAAPIQISLSANPNQLKTERLENNLRLYGECWLNSSKFSSPDGDDEGAFIVPALDARSHVLRIKGRRNGVGKPVFKLASLGSGQTSTLVAPELSVPGISLEVLQRVLSQANNVNV